MQRSSEGEENNSLIMILYPTLPKNDTRYIQMPWIAEIWMPACLHIQSSQVKILFLSISPNLRFNAYWKLVEDFDNLNELQQRLTSAAGKWQSYDSVLIAASTTNVVTSLKEEHHSTHQSNKLIETCPSTYLVQSVHRHVRLILSWSTYRRALVSWP